MAANALKKKQRYIRRSLMRGAGLMTLGAVAGCAAPASADNQAG